MARRAKGEGGIGKHKDGRYYAVFELPREADGKRRRKWVFGATKQEVRQALAALRRQHEHGADVAAKPETVAVFLRRWLDEVVAERCRPRTLTSYRCEVETRIIPHVGSVELGKLTPREVQTMVTALSRTRRRPKHNEHVEGKKLPLLSPRQVEYARAVLQRALNRALQWRLISYNPAALVDGPPQNPKPIVVLDEAQARVLLAVLRGHRLEVVFYVLLALGLRRGEACGLRWCDVDLVAGCLRVAQQYQRIGGKLVASPPKSKRGARPIALSSQLVALLRLHRARQDDERRERGPEWHEHGLVFPSNRGTPMEPNNLSRLLSNALEEAGLPHLGIHALRHSAATFLLAEGMDIRTVADVLGHASPAFTLATYVHSSVERQRAGIGRVTRLFGSGQAGEQAA
jgi:integrase